MAQVEPFRAVRYDVRRAGPLEALVAPPYDVIDAERRTELLGLSPYNVVHLTLPDDEEDAAREWRRWLDEGILVQDPDPSLWWLEQEYTGPDGITRRRGGVVGALRAEPYSAGVVLPHERTHAAPKEGRLRLLRALHAHVEPIFLLYAGRLEGPAGKPALEVLLDGVSNRLWRLPGEVPPELARAQLLIADGHHRYETALAFAGEEGRDAARRLLAVVVPTEQEGVTIFPTHRVARSLAPVDGREVATIEEGLAALPPDRSGTVVYRAGAATTVEGLAGEPDAALVERLRPEGVSYVPAVADAVGAVDSGAAEAALLVRAPAVELVWELARRGETMPQKTTYFFPKLPSGLLFLDVS